MCERLLDPVSSLSAAALSVETIESRHAECGDQCVAVVSAR